MVVKVDDVKALQKDLQEDFVINSTVSIVAGNMALRCGRLLAVASAALITAEHIEFEKKPEKEPGKNLSKTLLKTWIRTLQQLGCVFTRAINELNILSRICLQTEFY